MGDRRQENLPAQNIKKGSPHTIVFLGKEDHLIPASIAGNYKVKMEAVGSRCNPYENPTKICSHDMIIGRYCPIWHQNGAITGEQAAGSWKIEFVEDSEYSITLRRFPRESGLAINDVFPAQEKRVELDQTAPAGVKNDFTEARLYVAGITKSLKIKEGQSEVTFKVKVPAGKYDMEARLIDTDNRIHPAYYVYIEKL
ncbi:hypothetical protein [Ancylomarina sp. 16SWW S1-10-2]|uniref:hypothetical protein n=1 Tax=Ancylomarina sp. 16SWW S1-10-2 TaxID=2499681 RepID=UPI0012AEB02C|nr:hypothetical protein [Ancylomarina sp. 16SWW S1-10-2]MRT93783.1 hypothetical protein [Ancylomarina sp. 16SWW S1-10-2]